MPNIVYIPGLGGEKSVSAQRRYIKFLNVFKKSDNKIHFFNPQWETNEDYLTKYERLSNFYAEVGKPARLVGISAGASLAVRLTVENPEITSTHLICGKVTGASTIGQDYQQRAPAFLESVQHSESCVSDDINGDSFTCYIPKDNADNVINSPDMIVPNAKVVDLPRLKHARAIGFALIRYVPFL